MWLDKRIQALPGLRLAWILALLGLALLLRASALVGNHLRVDEPRWMVRGLFLLESLGRGDIRALQQEHGTGRITPEASKPSASLATGTATVVPRWTSTALWSPA